MEGEEHFSYTITGLVTYQLYKFSVCAVNVAGMCGRSAVLEGRSKQGGRSQQIKLINFMAAFTVRF